jgi:Flp pilus assembly pilin Flp
MKKGQSTIEYALLVAIVAAAFLAMHLYVQRSVQANFKLIENQINAEPQ